MATRPEHNFISQRPHSKPLPVKTLSQIGEHQKEQSMKLDQPGLAKSMDCIHHTLHHMRSIWQGNLLAMRESGSQPQTKSENTQNQLGKMFGWVLYIAV